MLTESICPVCYKKIPAELTVGTHVWMIKECPEHGRFSAMVERDPRWYFLCKELGCKEFYGGYLINITGECNLRCKHCYDEKKGGYRDVDSILYEAKYHGDKTPFILTGGEPTLHPRIIEAVNNMPGKTWMLTNGIKLADKEFFNKIIKTELFDNGTLNIGLSFHKESNGKDFECINNFRKAGLKIDTALLVISDVSEIGKALNIFSENRDVINNFKIKAASNLWSSNNATHKIFVSDMMAEVVKHGETEIDKEYKNKLSYASLVHRGMKLKLVSWYDKENVDLKDIDCAPYMMANDGTVNNLLTTILINEGIDANR